MGPLGLSGVDPGKQYRETDQWKPDNVSSASHKSSVDLHRSTEASLGVNTIGLNREALQYRDSMPNGSDVLQNKKAANAAVTVDAHGLSRLDANKKHKDTDSRKPGIPSSANQASSMDSLSHRSIAKSHRREGSSARPKSMMLDKAIKDLEKIVAESRPASTEVQDPDNSFQAVKRRLPLEIKLKLAKVARLAQSNCGAIPKDVINRLMSIVGHLMQVRTLKRNLKLMAKIGLTAKQEKDDRIRRIKQEIAEMVELQVSSLKPNVEHLAANSDGIHEDGQETKDGRKPKYCMDDMLENKICELCEVYLEGGDEDSHPSVRKLYEELTVLWPNGFTDVDGVKRAIHRAKERKGLHSLFKREKIRMKRPPLAQEAEEDPEKAPLLMHSHKKKLALDSHEHGFTSNVRPTTVSHFRPHAPPTASSDGPAVDTMALDKARGSLTISSVDGVPRKKLKKKPPTDALEDQYHPKKFASALSKEQQIQQKQQLTAPLSKPNFQPGGGNP